MEKLAILTNAKGSLEDMGKGLRCFVPRHFPLLVVLVLARPSQFTTDTALLQLCPARELCIICLHFYSLVEEEQVIHAYT